MNLGSQLFNKQTLPVGLPGLARAAPWVLVHCYSAPAGRLEGSYPRSPDRKDRDRSYIVLPQIGHSCVGLKRGVLPGSWGLCVWLQMGSGWRESYSVQLRTAWDGVLFILVRI